MGTPPLHMFRTLLFAPGSRPELLAKAQTSNADALIFDLEDSVPANAKDEARRNVAHALAGGLQKPMYLRINNPRAGDYRADLALLAQAPAATHVVGVILPKADDAHDVQTVAAELHAIEAARGAPDGALAILPLIETCLGLRNTFDIAALRPGSAAWHWPVRKRAISWSISVAAGRRAAWRWPIRAARWWSTRAPPGCSGSSMACS